MKILLISLNRETEPFAAAPLGLALVAASLRAAGHEVRALDLLFAEDPVTEITAALAGFEPGMIGVSIRNIESSTEFLLPSYRELIREIKRLSSAPIVAGGPGFSVMPGQTLEYLGLEIGVAGEGECAVVELARALETGGPVAGIPGVYTLKGGRHGHVPSEPVWDFSGDRPPAWDLFPVSRYDMVGVQSKRGCSFSCVYCTYPALEGRRMRLREPESVVREIEGAVRAGASGAFYFVDNVFNNPGHHAEAVCRAITASALSPSWGCLVSPLGLDERLLELMAGAGCQSVEIGADSVSDRALAGLGKRFEAADVKRAVKACKSAGMMHMVFLLLGGPGEDKDTLRETFDALDALSPDKVFAVAGVRIYHGTPMARIAEEEGVITPGESLLMPSFYVSPKIGDELYSLSEDFFRAHPGWIYYPAKAVAAAKPAPVRALEMGWDKAASGSFERALASVPLLLRPIAKKAVARKADSLARDRGLVLVDAACVRDAFLSETPGPFQGPMRESLKKLGLLGGRE